ncbi:MAG: hypothetical protein ABI467_20665 [Kofleriaceae bacterium]
MQLVWGLIVAWVMVASAPPCRSHEAPHAGISVAPAFQHPVRKRELPTWVGPIVSPARVVVIVPPLVAIVRIEATRSIGGHRGAAASHARAPPVG